MLAELVSLVRTRLRRRAGWVGADIGSAMVKLAEVEQSADGCRLVHTLIVPQEPPEANTAWTEGPLFPPQAISRLKVRKGFLDRSVAAALSMSAVELRSLSLPRVGENELESLIAQELQPDGPSSPPQFDWWDRISGSTDELLPLYALSVSESLSTRVGTALVQSGVVPQALDSVPHALARAAGLVSDPEVPVGLLDWGASTATFIVAHRLQPIFVRVLKACGLRHWQETVGKAFELSVGEADQLLREQGLPVICSNTTREVDELLGDAVLPLLHQLSAELKRTLQYLTNESSANCPARLVLFGGGATLPNASTVLEGQLGMPVSVWEIPNSHGEFTGFGPLLGVAVGLSLLGLPDGGAS